MSLRVTSSHRRPSCDAICGEARAFLIRGADGPLEVGLPRVVVVAAARLRFVCLTLGHSIALCFFSLTPMASNVLDFVAQISVIVWDFNPTPFRNPCSSPFPSLPFL